MKLIKDLGMLAPKLTSNYKVRYGLYECPICHKHFKTITNSVKRGKSTKCNSCASRLASTTHGMSKNSKNYHRWEQMKQRCLNPNAPKFNYYGDKGITIFPEWQTSFTAYNTYIENLPNADKEGWTIDRIKVDKGYWPDNLRWASKKLQARNTGETTKGVTWDKQRNRWYAHITINYKMMNLGYYKNKDEAIQARKEAEKRYNFYAE